jgi:hypothetical protein
MDHESRQVVFGLRVQEVVPEADPVNCHPPAIEISHPPPTIEFDTSSSFLTDKAFKWVRDVAGKLQFATVIVNSDYDNGKRKQKLVLGCKRGGVY